ncbi:MAG TPA: histidine--tRNA ligase [Candidatus Saccharimonadales bacterium]|jgi:histidyl-tRNA synthetase|nr:histidine--tRNA ligase [Candidatus Saccharimonadales bacterium]
MSLSTEPYKGARDFYPEDERLQKYMFDVMRHTVESFGYEEYDAPILEPLELFLAKTSDEVVNEQTYAFEDRGGRKVVIRPEMTPTVSRMVAAKRQELAYPLRWYSIPNLWRYERPQRGRLREHWQLNVDLFGIDNIAAETEIIQVAGAIMHNFGATHEMYTIKLNSRKLLDQLLSDYLKLGDVQQQTLRRLIDRRNKMEESEFLAEADSVLNPSQHEANLSEKLLDLLNIKSIDNLPAEFKDHASVHELNILMTDLQKLLITNIEFDISLVRGFDYYNDIVFEVNDNHPDNNRSMFGGGRYDGLVGLFGVEPLPSVGFGMGDITMKNFLELHNLLPNIRPETDVYAVLIGDVASKAHTVIADLREMGLNVAVDFSGRKTDKQIQSAVKKGIHYVLFIGEKELDSEQYTIKNLITGVEEQHSIQRIVSIVKDYRQQ